MEAVTDERITDDRLREVAEAGCAQLPSIADVERHKLAAEVLVLRDQVKQPGVLTFAERALVHEVCHDLINRAMFSGPQGDSDRAKEAAIRKLLGDKP